MPYRCACVVALMSVSFACTSTPVGGGGSVAASQGSTHASSTSVSSTATGTGACVGGTPDGVCDIARGEACGVCADCVPGSMDCGGGCTTNGVCDKHEPCTCPDCAMEPSCRGVACVDDGRCDYFFEGCSCMDCANAPVCTTGASTSSSSSSSASG